MNDGSLYNTAPSAPREDQQPKTTIFDNALSDIEEEYYCQIRALCPRIPKFDAYAMAFQSDYFNVKSTEAPKIKNRIFKAYMELEEKRKDRIEELRGHPDLQAEIEVSAGRNERKLKWTQILRDPTSSKEEQMKASRLLAQVDGDFDTKTSRVGDGGILNFWMNLSGDPNVVKPSTEISGDGIHVPVLGRIEGSIPPLRRLPGQAVQGKDKMENRGVPDACPPPADLPLNAPPADRKKMSATPWLDPEGD